MRTEATIKRPLLKFCLNIFDFFRLFGITGAMIALNVPKLIPDALQVICGGRPSSLFAC